jgi:hypothetical protein
MVGTIKTMIDLGLQSQIARLREIVEGYKDWAVEEARQTAVSIGIMLALAFAALFFLLIALCAALVALFLWVGEEYGPFVALGVVCAVAVAIALVLLAIMALRGGRKSAPARKPVVVAAAAVNIPNPIDGLVRSAVKAADEMTGKAKETVESVERAGAAARDALDNAVETIKNGSRPALFATIAGTVVLGMMLARRR